MSAGVRDVLATVRAAQGALKADPLQAQQERDAARPLPPDIPPHIVQSVERGKLLRQVPFFMCPPWAAMPPFGGAHMEIIKDGACIGVWSLAVYPYYMIGQDKAVCDYCMDHPSISRHHCVLVFHGEHRTFYVVDLRSTNGVFVNGERIKPSAPVPLPFGASLRLGNSTRTLLLSKDPPREAHLRHNGPRNANLTVPPAQQFGRDGPEALLSATEPMSAMATTTHSEPNRSGAVTAPAAVPPAMSSSSTPVASAATAVTAPVQAVAAVPEAAPVVVSRHFRHLLIKHVGVDKPVSRAPRNKGEAITRSPEDAEELARSLRQLFAVGGTCDDATFADYCERFSECATAKKGGDLGVVERGTFGDAFEASAFSLGPKGVSAPVVTVLGVHLIYRCPPPAAESASA